MRPFPVRSKRASGDPPPHIRRSLMPSHFHAHFESWSLPAPVTLAVVLAAFVYARGWFCLRKASPNSISLWQLCAFMSGLVSLWIALGSPLVALDHHLLSIHMVEHILLMTVAPLLILLGAPVLVFLPAFPQGFLGWTQGLVLRWQTAQGSWENIDVEPGQVAPSPWPSPLKRGRGKEESRANSLAPSGREGARSDSGREG